jgi:chromosome segregation ATPase
MLKQIEERGSRIQALDNEIQHIKTKLKLSNDRVHCLERSMSKVKANLNEKTNEVSKLEQMESDLTKLKTNLSKLRWSNEKSLRNLHNASEREAESQNKVSKLEKELEALKLDLTRLRNTNRSLTQKLKDSSAKLQELQNGIESNPSGESCVEELKQKIIRLKNDNAEIRGELSALKLKASGDPVKLISKEKGDSKDHRIIHDDLKAHNFKLEQNLASIRQSIQNEYQSKVDLLQAEVSDINQYLGIFLDSLYSQ